MTAFLASAQHVSTVDSLWLVDRKASSAALQAMERTCSRLSAADVTRAETIAGLSSERAEYWRAGRIALRVIIERLIVASDWAAPVEQFRRQPFKLTAHGEPSLPGAPLVFSQSDAGPYLLIGVASQGRIGVDLEQPRTFAMSTSRQASVVAVARSLVGCQGLAENDSGVSLDLLQAWTRIEAFAKARGPSLARVLTELGLIGGAADVDIPARAAAIAAETGMMIHDVKLPHGLIASVARPKGTPLPPLALFVASSEPDGCVGPIVRTA